MYACVSVKVRGSNPCKMSLTERELACETMINYSISDWLAGLFLLSHLPSLPPIPNVLCISWNFSQNRVVSSKMLVIQNKLLDFNMQSNIIIIIKKNTRHIFPHPFILAYARKSHVSTFSHVHDTLPLKMHFVTYHQMRKVQTGIFIADVIIQDPSPNGFSNQQCIECKLSTENLFYSLNDEQSLPVSLKYHSDF